MTAKSAVNCGLWMNGGVVERVVVSQAAPVVLSPARPFGLMVIAVFKLVSSVVLFAVALGAFELMRATGMAWLAQWIPLLRGDADERFLQHLLIQLSLVTPRTLEAVSAGTALYATLLLTEGVGLWLRKRWAEYFTVIVTASLIPLELYEIVRRLTVTNLVILGTNIIIVVYLVMRVLRTQGIHR